MLDAIQKINRSIGISTGAVHDLAVEVCRLEPSIKSLVIDNGDVDALKVARNRLSYCLKDMSKLLDLIVASADSLDENFVQLDELIS